MSNILNNTKKFVKKHWRGVAICGAAIGGVIMCRKTLLRGSVFMDMIRSYDTGKVLEVPKGLADYDVLMIRDYVKADNLEVILSSNFTKTVADLGDVGEALCSIPNVSSDSKMYALISIIKDKES